MLQYWHYKQADVYVPNKIKTIMSIDGGNVISKLGDTYCSTYIKIFRKPYTIEEYHDKYCVYNKELKKWIFK